MRKAAAVVSFFGAFLIGALPAYLLGWGADDSVMGRHDPGEVQVSYVLSPVTDTGDAAVWAEDLVGEWRGSWGYEGSGCTIEIKRVDGVKFYGTLKKEGAVISLEGYIDPARRHVHFKETKVVRLGPAMSMWSLGINSGNFSPDGRTLSGEGTDEFGTYAWSATKVQN